MLSARIHGPTLEITAIMKALLALLPALFLAQAFAAEPPAQGSVLRERG